MMPSRPQYIKQNSYNKMRSWGNSQLSDLVYDDDLDDECKYEQIIDFAMHLNDTEGYREASRFKEQALRMLDDFVRMKHEERKWTKRKPAPAEPAKSKKQLEKESNITIAKLAHKKKMNKPNRELLALITPTDSPLEYMELLRMNGISDAEEAKYYYDKHYSYYSKQSPLMTTKQATEFSNRYEQASEYIKKHFDDEATAIGPELLEQASSQLAALSEDDGLDYDLVPEIVNVMEEYTVSESSTDLKIMLSRDFTDEEFKELDNKYSAFTVDLIREGSEQRMEEHADVFFGRADGQVFVRLNTHSLGSMDRKESYPVPSIEDALEQFMDGDLTSYTIIQAAMGGTWYDKFVGNKVFAYVDKYDRLVTPVTRKVLWHIDVAKSVNPFVDRLVLKTRYVKKETGNKVKKPRPKKDGLASKIERSEAMVENLQEWLFETREDHPLAANVREILATIEKVTAGKSNKQGSPTAVTKDARTGKDVIKVSYREPTGTSDADWFTVYDAK